MLTKVKTHHQSGPYFKYFGNCQINYLDFHPTSTDPNCASYGRRK